MTLKEKANHYAELVAQRKMIEAIELYYHDNITQYEPAGEPLSGKQMLLVKEKTVQAQIELVTSEVEIESVDHNSGRVTGTMFFEFRNPETGARTLRERFEQLWKDGKIIEQRFIY